MNSAGQRVVSVSGDGQRVSVRDYRVNEALGCQVLSASSIVAMMI